LKAATLYWRAIGRIAWTVLPIGRAMYSVHRIGRLYCCSHFNALFEIGGVP
jgi:hypothetical protein